MTKEEAINCIKAAPTVYKYYCYGLFKQNGEPFYFGIGQNSRILHHEQYHKKKYSHNNLKNGIINRIKSNNESVVYELFLFSQDRALMENLEIAMIGYYGRLNNSTGILANLSDGGETGKSHIVTPEVRKLLSIKAKEQWKCPKALALRSIQSKAQSAALKDNPEFKKKISKKSTAMWADPEFKARLSLKHTELWTDPIYREKRALAKQRSKRKKILKAVLTTGKHSEDFTNLVLNRLKNIVQNILDKKE